MTTIPNELMKQIREKLIKEQMSSLESAAIKIGFARCEQCGEIICDHDLKGEDET